MEEFSQPPQPKSSVALVSTRGGSSLLPTSIHSGTPYGFEVAENAEFDLALFKYWAALRRNARAILLSGAVGLLIGFCVSVPMEPKFRTSTKVEVLAVNENFLNMKDTNPINNGPDSDVSEEETQAQLMSSDTMVDRVVERLSPKTDSPVSASVPVSFWRSFFRLAPDSALHRRLTLIGKTAGTLKVSATPRTRIIQATIESSDPQLAAEFLNTLSQEFIKQNQESRLLNTEHTGDWLSHELQDARNNLRKSEDALQEYARNSGILLTNETTNVATEKLQQFQQSLSAAIADRISKQSRYELAQSTPPDSLADVLHDPPLHETEAKINDIKSQIADLTAIYSVKYSKVRRLQAEMQSLQMTFDRQRLEMLKSIQTDYDESLRKERLLSRAYDDQAREVTGQGEKGIQYNILKRDLDSNRQLYDAMLQQMKQASIATAMRASNVRVVDAAKVPATPFSPNFKINSAIGFMAGLLLSSVVVLIRDQIDRTLQVPGDIKQIPELIELGVIPNAALASSKRYYANYSSSKLAISEDQQSGSRASLELPDGSPGNVVELAAWQRKPSLLAESFRSVLTSILFVGDDGNRPRVLVFTSADAAEGKTTIVSNLAIAASEIRLKVLVIDADLRRPRMHQLFNLPNSRGLTDFLQEQVTDDSFAGMVQQTSIPNLHLMTAGPETHAAAHLLYSPNFARLIVDLRDEYDMILIDTPPMLQITDARIIGRQADAVILVARAGVTSRDSLVAAKERFDDDRIRVLGSILNDWNPKRRSENYYSGSSKQRAS